MFDTGYVVKNEKGNYYCGYGQFSPQLRQAKIYHAFKHAENIITSGKYRDMLFQIVKVEIKEI